MSYCNSWATSILSIPSGQHEFREQFAAICNGRKRSEPSAPPEARERSWRQGVQAPWRQRCAMTGHPERIAAPSASPAGFVSATPPRSNSAARDSARRVQTPAPAHGPTASIVALGAFSYSVACFGIEKELYSACNGVRLGFDPPTL